MTSSGFRDIPPDVLDQAIAWLVRLRSGMLDTVAYQRLQEEVQAWRRAATIHEAAWQELQAAEHGFAVVQATQRVHAAHTLATVGRHRATRQSRRKALRVLGLAGVGIAIGTLAMTQPPLQKWTAGLGADHVTVAGERRTVAFTDGTRIVLNTDTAIDVRYTNAQRLIVLRRGEIFIHTGKDEDAGGRRRFVVRTAQTQLEAIGTQFFVEQEQGTTRLQVTQGRVAIRPDRETGLGHDVIAAAGDAYRIDVHGAAVISDDSGHDARAWLDGALVARQMRLGDLVAQLARYRKGWLRCEPAIADLRVSGVFQLDDTDRALESLVQTLPIAMVSHTRYWVTLKAM